MSLPPEWRREPTEAQPERYVCKHPALGTDLLSVSRGEDGLWRWWWANETDTVGPSVDGWAEREDAQYAAINWGLERALREGGEVAR